MKGVIIFGVLTGFEIAPCQRPNFGNCQIKSNKVKQECTSRIVVVICL